MYYQQSNIELYCSVERDMYMSMCLYCKEKWTVVHIEIYTCVHTVSTSECLLSAKKNVYGSAHRDVHLCVQRNTYVYMFVCVHT